MAEEPSDTSGSDSDKYLDLNDAAEYLGVHYQTIYRWVREGNIPAIKVGTRYQVKVSDLESFTRRRFEPTPPPEVTKVRNWEDIQRRFYENLIDFNEVAATDQINRLVTGSVDVVAILDKLISPVLRMIGEGWRNGEISISQEHRASRLIHRIIDTMDVARRGRPHGRVIVTTPSNEEHEIPAAMASVALKAEHWTVINLGARVPPHDLIAFAVKERADLVVLSVTMSKHRAEADETARKLAQVNIACIVGETGVSLRELLDRAALAVNS
ncbi:MAG: helix-turn-helix domain-containing protein [Actinomycetota bacterium]|nr:helix-turn-helix domain-containing protein [Actinomycetota bacterium]